MKKIFLKLCVMGVAVFTSAVEAKLPQFNIHCEQSPEVYFTIIYKNLSSMEYYEAGYSFRGTEVGNPDLCDLKSNNEGHMHLWCEDQNIDISYELKFNLPQDGSFFEVEMINQERKIETFNLCRKV